MDIETNPRPVLDIKLFHWNARSIRHKLDYLEDICEDCTVLSISETHLDDQVHTSDLLIEGFNEPYRNDRTFSGGGVMVYVSSAIYSRRIVDLEIYGIEMIWLELLSGRSRILLCTVYRPPNA